MESKEKVEIIDLAIQQLMEEQQQQTDMNHVMSPAGKSSVDGDDNQLLLHGLLSQLQEVKDDGELQQADLKNLPLGIAEEAEKKKKIVEDNEVSSSGDNGHDKIVKELKKVQRQNFITHCLLSAMIVLTVTWQLSEVSLVLKLKDGIDHPFRSIGSMLKWMVKGPPKSNAPKSNGGENQSSPILAPIQQQIEGASLPSLKIPDVATTFE